METDCRNLQGELYNRPDVGGARLGRTSNIPSSMSDERRRDDDEWLSESFPVH